MQYVLSPLHEDAFVCLRLNPFHGSLISQKKVIPYINV